MNVLLCLCLCMATAAVTEKTLQSDDPDLITSLPGWKLDPHQNMYSGYVTVDEANSRNLFYWLVESSSPTAATDPLVLWTNGGPGCSGISGGLFSEFGPFFPNIDGSLSLTPNPWTWTQKANIIFIEQPAGVGYSFSDNSSDYNVGDERSASDVYFFLQGFLKKHKRFTTNDLYLSGESYGGHYVPSFAKKIVEENKRGVYPLLNLKGFLVGNAWTVAEDDNTGALDFWYQRTMISSTMREGLLTTCNMSDIGPIMATRTKAVRLEADWELELGVELGSKRGSRPLGFSPRFVVVVDHTGHTKKKEATYKGLNCDQWQNKTMNNLNGIDIYDVYSNVCPQQLPVKDVRQISRQLSSIPTSNGLSGCATNYDPCRDQKTTRYMNNPAVKASIHANATITWAGCSSIVNYSRFDLLSSMIPVYDELLNQEPPLRVLVFSGDVDAIVPSVGTRTWLKRLRLQETEEIRPWSLNEQVGGWVTTYEKNLSFATVRNAGHFVPGLQGSRALYLFEKFLNNERL